jgi:hypothetical protein
MQDLPEIITGINIYFILFALIIFAIACRTNGFMPGNQLPYALKTNR